MKTMRALFCIALSSALALPVPSGATVKGDVKVGVEVFTGDQDNAKFREYRYNTDSPLGAYTEVGLRAEPSESRFYELGLKARTDEDVDLGLETGSYGVYKVGLGFSRMGHNFAFGAKSLYSGVGTDKLTIPDSTQAALQGTGGTRLPPAILNFVNTTGLVDVGLRRDRAGLDLDWNLSEPLAVKVAADYEKRKGSRPFGAAFGSPGGLAVEVLEPIDYDTSRFEGGVEYAGESFFASLHHSLSVFSNAYTGFQFDNPLRATDSPTAGAAVGRAALAPDNMANHLSASYAQKLPLHSRVTATAGFGWLRQNDDLLPVTSNSRLTPGALPRTTADAKVDTRLYSLSLTSRPLKKLHVKAGYRYDQHQNNTPVFSITRWSVSDASISATPKSSNYVSVVKRVAELEAAYDILSKTTLSLGAENEHANFDNGSADRENENVYKVSLDTHKIRHTDLRLTLEHAVKNSDYPDYVRANAELPWMQKYYAASRDTNRAIVMASVAPGDRLTLGFEGTYSKDDYPESEFGLQESHSQSVSVDVDYAVTDRVTVAPFYTVEVHESRQRNRQWNPRGIGDPYETAYSAFDTRSNWTIDTRDLIHTPGLNLGVILVPEKLDFNATGSYALANTTLDFDSAVGTAANDVNAFVPQDPTDVDDNYLIAVNSLLNYNVKKDLSVGLGYLYQRWSVKDDLIYDGYTPAATTGTGTFNNLLTMDTQYKSYNVQAVYVQASCRF